MADIKDKTLDDLLKSAQEGLSEEEKSIAINEIIRRNTKSIHYMIRKKYGSRLHKILQSYRITYDDLYSVGLFSIYQAIQYYDPKKSASFSTYMFNSINNHLYQHFRGKKMKNIASNASLDAEIGNNHDDDSFTLMDIVAESLSVDGDSTLKDDYLEALKVIEILESSGDIPEKQMKVYEGYLMGYTQRELSVKYGISQSYVSRILTKIQEKARKIRETIERG